MRRGANELDLPTLEPRTNRIPITHHTSYAFYDPLSKRNLSVVTTVQVTSPETVKMRGLGLRIVHLTTVNSTSFIVNSHRDNCGPTDIAG